MNEVLLYIIGCGVVLFAGWAGVFSRHDPVKQIQGIILIFLSIISLLFIMARQSLNNEMVYLGYLILLLINILIIVLSMLMRDSFLFEERKGKQ